MDFSRRDFLKKVGATALATTAMTDIWAGPTKKMFYEISLAEWSLHKALFAKKLTNLDFPELARKEFGIEIVEYVNQFFKDKANDTTYLKELLKRSKDNGVRNHLIMIDGEGGTAELEDATRKKAVENHYKWVDAAKFLGCKTIRVNAYGKGSAEDVAKAAVDGLGRLGEFAAKSNINVIVENHGGYSSNGEWLSGVMKQINMKNVGTLPDFGNFCIDRKPNSRECANDYDRYKGVKELMPFAKGVSAKTHDFDANGNDTEIDYVKMMKIVKDSGFKGIAGIEYEGSTLPEYEGIKATKALLEKVGQMVS
ncbi:sugar phosphate isomerase/epimerase family protein [Telluribacter humicola]|uniref:sugar phosphate isomerase/epimerase family protein n=1 Tax=Telluribacter humicola TaxID=1720261 RepID=UPI001A9705C2|nr:sugar phosphate isomerase/epimerase family protein [Telluribacter humicola]